MLTDARGQPAVAAPVAIAILSMQGNPQALDRLRHLDLEAVTGPDGRFEAALESERLGPVAAVDPADQDANPGPGLVHVEARFAGSPALGESSAQQTLDLHKLDAILELRLAATKLTTETATVDVEIDAMSGDVPLGAAEVRLASDGKTLVTVRTAADGHAEATLPVAQLGAAGPHLLTANLDATDQVNAAETSQRLDLVGSVAVDLQVERGEVGKPCGAEDFCVHGAVFTLQGETRQPVPAAALTLHVERQQLGTLVTDSDGRFAAILHGDRLLKQFKPGSLGLVARAQVPMPFHEVGWSPIAIVELRPPPSLSGWLYGAALAALAAVAVVGRWRARRRELALLDQREADAAGLPSQAVRRLGPGGEASCLVRGQVVHGETGRPVAAHLAFTRAGREEAGHGLPDLEVDSLDGRFHVDGLSAGRWTLLVHCAEHEALDVAIDLPHDGTFDGCELLPASCRAVVRGSFANSVRRFTGRAVDWSRETPRDVEPRWSGSVRRGQGEVRNAVREVERALYGARTEPDTAAQARQAVARVEEAQR